MRNVPVGDLRRVPACCLLLLRAGLVTLNYPSAAWDRIIVRLRRIISSAHNREREKLKNAVVVLHRGYYIILYGVAPNNNNERNMHSSTVAVYMLARDADG